MSWLEDACLLDDLAGALDTGAPFPPEPPSQHLDIFRAAVALHCQRPASIPGPTVAKHHRRAARQTVRIGAMAAAMVVAVASGAAASVGSDGLPLPRRVRAVADAVGLPVDSVALDDTHQHLHQLQSAVQAKDHRRAELAITRLRHDVLHLPEDERRKAEPEVETALADATTSLAEPGPGRSPANPTAGSNAPLPAAPARTATPTGGQPLKERTGAPPLATTPAPSVPDAPPPTTAMDATGGFTADLADPAGGPSQDPGMDPEAGQAAADSPNTAGAISSEEESADTGGPPSRADDEPAATSAAMP